MYEKYWKQQGEKATVVIPGWETMSYFSDVKNICWFLEPEFSKQVIRLHNVVGNAVTEGRHIVVGTGSSQLFLAALFALSSKDPSYHPIDVVSASPYYSVRLLSPIYLFIMFDDFVSFMFIIGLVYTSLATGSSNFLMFF